MHKALRATTATLVNVLQNKLISDPDLATLFTGMGVSDNTPQEMQDEQQGLSVWLYRIERDNQTLNRPPGRLSINQLESPPLPLRLYYLMTPIVNNTNGNGPTLEQEILGMVLQTFNDNPILKGSDLQEDLNGTDTQIAVRFESLDLETITRVWDALESSYQLSVSYEVTVIPICTAKQPMPISPVESVTHEQGLILSSIGGP